MMKNHPYLSIEIIPQNQERLYVHFRDVAYLQCPIGWVGSEFCIAIEEECKQITNRISSKVSEHASLYVVKRVEVEGRISWVRILAVLSDVTNESPYFWQADLID
jgi:hypothetical protein